MAEGGVTIIDPSILKTNRVVLVEKLVELDSILAGLKPFLQYPELDAIHGEPNRGAKIGKIIDYLQRRVVSKSYNAFNAFVSIVAGVQPDLFTTLAGRAPTRSEADFCVKDYVQAMKEQIQASGHITDSSLDEKIDLDLQHVQLKITSERKGINVRDESIPVSSVLDVPAGSLFPNFYPDGGKPKKVSLHGRAGTGKTTTMQWLARQWSSNKWGAEFTMIFLVQLRMLSLSDIPVTAIELMIAYSLYCVRKDDLVTLGASWIKNSASRLLIFIDGLDEIGGFRSRLRNCHKITDWNVKAHPIDICLNIIRGNLLPGCTVICGSRTFSGLSDIKFDRELEIIGLTEDRIEEFVRQKHPSKAVDIMSVLQENPLLMSVCSITFYCALISRLLADGVIFQGEDLQTYTRLIAFLVVQCVTRRAPECPFVVQANSSIPKLAKMAYTGILESCRNKEVPKLVFSEHDIGIAGISQTELKSIEKFGLLQMKTVKVPLRESMIAEFVHFSVQEMLASAYLLSKCTISDDMFGHFLSGHFDMAFLYTFGLQYDTGSRWVRDIQIAADPSRQGSSNITDQQFDRCIEGPWCLFFCKLVYESQREDKARKLARSTPDRLMLRQEMIMIDILALSFVCKYADNISRISMNGCNMTAAMVKSFASVLEANKRRLRELDLWDNNIGDTGAKTLAEALAHNNAIHQLNVGKNNISAYGAMSLVEGLRSNRSLRGLDLSYNHISDTGANALAATIIPNNNLYSIRFEGNELGKESRTALREALCSRKASSFAPALADSSSEFRAGPKPTESRPEPTESRPEPTESRPEPTWTEKWCRLS